jgi:hypothetical protein
MLQCLASSAVQAEVRYFQIRINEPYIELHTGPGRGYPVFHVIDRGEVVEVIKRRTDWFMLRTARGKEGWARRSAMMLTLTPDGDKTEFAEADFGDFSRRRWELGVMAGDFEGANIITAHTGYMVTRNLSVELQLSQAFGNFSDALIGSINLLAQPFPEWRASPFFLLGTGAIYTDPNVTLVGEEDRLEQITNVGVGLRVYLTRRFVFRAEYQNHVILQKTDDNQEINEWKAGFAFFF